MANNFAPFGFLPEAGADGAAPTYGTTWVPVSASDTTKIFRGDPVKRLATGLVAQWTAATAVSQFAGIFWGCQYYSISRQEKTYSKYWPGADAATGSVLAQIIPSNTAVPLKFKVQTANSNTTAVAVTQADVGQNVDVSLGSGNTLSGMSTAYADINTFGTAATLPFTIVDLYPGVGASTNGGNGSDATSAYNWIVVQANVYKTTGI